MQKIQRIALLAALCLAAACGTDTAGGDAGDPNDSGPAVEGGDDGGPDADGTSHRFTVEVGDGRGAPVSLSVDAGKFLFVAPDVHSRVLRAIPGLFLLGCLGAGGGLGVGLLEARQLGALHNTPGPEGEWTQTPCRGAHWLP